MHVLTLQGKTIVESDAMPQQLPEQGFLWLSFSRREFEVLQSEIQSMLETVCKVQLFDLHVFLAKL